MSTTPRTDEVYDRRLAPEKPGITGHELSKQLETELAAMKTRAELAEAGVERLKGYCEQLHTIIDNKLFPSGTDYAKMTARAEKAEAECLEQARLLGISGSREAALLSEIECLKKIVAESQQLINTNVNKHDL